MVRRGHALLFARLLVFLFLLTTLPGCGGGGGYGGAAQTSANLPLIAGQTGNVVASSNQTDVTVTGLTPGEVYSLASGPAAKDLSSAAQTVIATARANSAGIAVFAAVPVSNGLRLCVYNAAQAIVADVIVTIQQGGAGSENHPPVATDPTAQTVAIGALVTLHVTATDADQDNLTYAWVQSSGPTAALAGASTASPTFTPSQAGTYVFTVTVSDNRNGSDTAQATVTVNPAAHQSPTITAGAALSPTANVSASPSLSVAAGTQVSLMVTAQAHDGATIATYAWTQTSPTSPQLTIANANSATAVITPASAGTFVFQVTVTDSLSAQGIGTVTLTVNPANRAPVANAGPAQFTVGYGKTVTLNGSGSTDPDAGQILTYSWTQTASDKVKVQFQNANTANPSFVTTSIEGAFSGAHMPISTTHYGVLGVPYYASPWYNFTLTVRDPMGLTKTGTVEVCSQFHTAGTTSVALGSRVYLVCPPKVSYSWAFAATSGRPTGSTTTLVDATTRFPYFIPDRAGLYKLQEGSSKQLVVNASTYVGMSNCTSCHSQSINAIKPPRTIPDQATPFAQTYHANNLKYQLNGNRSSSYREYCLRCHTVGYDQTPGIKSNGFYENQRELGWSIPSPLTATNYANFEAQYPDLANLGSVGCENCHGPGANHGGSTQKIAMSLDSGVCAKCHRNQPFEWHESEGHTQVSEPNSPTSPATRAGCAGCHSGKGFISAADSVAANNWTTIPKVNSFTSAPWTAPATGMVEISCAVCHDPHKTSTPAPANGSGTATSDRQLRIYNKKIQLTDNTVVSNTGAGATCMFCHRARKGASAADSSATTIAHYGPHYNPQADMLEGVGGYEYTTYTAMGADYGSSPHKTVVSDKCVGCHMASPASNSGINAGKHSWRMKAEDGKLNVAAACATSGCHAGLTTYDKPAGGDYDGDGVMEGVQSEVKGLLEKLEHELETQNPTGWAWYKTPSTNHDAGRLTKTQRRALWNVDFVEEDKSHGVHNATYAIQLLQRSYKDLTGRNVSTDIR